MKNDFIGLMKMFVLVCLASYAIYRLRHDQSILGKLLFYASCFVVIMVFLVTLLYFNV